MTESLTKLSLSELDKNKYDTFEILITNNNIFIMKEYFAKENYEFTNYMSPELFV